MKCPNDQTTLLISERQNIEIDYCPECRGVWLDRGELDKLIEKNAPNTDRESQSFTHNRDSQPHRQPNNDHHYKKKHRESFLGDLFDF